MSLTDEKAVVDRGIKSAVVSGGCWEPISSAWFERWSRYVDASINETIVSGDAVDRTRIDEDESKSMHPGEIDNSPFCGEVEGEIKDGIAEEKDYVLMPKLTADMLFTKYGGGPRFPRPVINTGTVISPIYQVSIHRVRVIAYHSTKLHPSPWMSATDNAVPNGSTGDSTRVVKYFPRQCTFSDAVNQLSAYFKIDYQYSTVRCWIKDEENAPIDDDQPRLLTQEATAWTGPWQCLVDNRFHDRTMIDVRGNQPFIELMIEDTPGKKPIESSWPRAVIMSQWKYCLRVGDCFDASDTKGEWYNAIVKQIDEPIDPTKRSGKEDAGGKVHVHFKGWSANFDEMILPAERKTRIKPLYSQTVDRRGWSEGDFVDVRVSSRRERAIWIAAEIIELDSATDRVKVKYSIDERNSALSRFKIKVSLDEEERAAQEGDSTSDDQAARSSNGFEDDGKSILKWIAMLSDDICPLNTHTPRTNKPAEPVRTNASNGKGSVNSIGNIGSSISSSLSMVLSKPFGGRSYVDYSEKHVKGTPMIVGAVGLQNLGNTCFMNSILQCVSHTKVITDHFLSDTFKAEINTDNPLGHNGKVALSYGKLIKDMWCNSYTKVIPREFKVTIGEFQPQFAGYDQQDSQEFLGFLLDGLHEDLNRCLKKPAVAKIESKGRDDSLIAAESWRRYLLRNDSFLVDNCYGLLKSHVTCTNCGKESVTFDAFSSLSLPLPVRNTRGISVIAQLLPRGSQPVKLELEVEVTATMNELKKILVDTLLSMHLIHIPVNGVSQNSKSEGSFEMVSHDDVNHVGTENGFQFVESPDKPPPPPPTPSTATPVYDSYHFHFGTLFSHRPASIFKHFNAAEAGGTSIQAYVGKMDMLIAFQLESMAPEFRSSIYYSSHSRRVQYPETDETASHVAVDVCIGVKKTTTYGNYERVELQAYPQRIVVPKDCTNQYVHTAVWEVMERFLADDSLHNKINGSSTEGAMDLDKAEDEMKGDSNDVTNDGEGNGKGTANSSSRPYTIAVMNSYATATKRTITCDDEIFRPPAGGIDMLVCLWQERDLDADRVIAVRTGAIDATSSVSVDSSDSQSKKQQLNLQHCLEKFSEREQLADTETLYCSQCKQHLAPIKKMDVWAAPDILVLHLKRFQYIPGQYFVHREKITDLVEFPIEGLDLSNFVIGSKDANVPPVYDLYGISHHSGGLGGGHYTATCKSPVNGSWYHFNDSMVTPVQPESAITSTAYVLFYKRRSSKQLRWAGIEPAAVALPDEEEE